MKVNTESRDSVGAGNLPLFLPCLAVCKSIPSAPATPINSENSLSLLASARPKKCPCTRGKTLRQWHLGKGVEKHEQKVYQFPAEKRLPKMPLRPDGVINMTNKPTLVAANNGGKTSQPARPAQPQSKKYQADICQNDQLDQEFYELVLGLEKALGFDLWLLIQNDGEIDDIGEKLYKGLREKKDKIKGRVGLLLHSPGGDASYAYKIIRMFQMRSEEFYTVVPLYAKSAATLMAVGGKQIIMGMEAELGPLDVQLYNAEKEGYDSALNSVQSLERLNAYALTAFDQAMQLFISRMRKKPDVLMPMAINYATTMIKPLVEKIDTFDLTRKSRDLKVAEDYAVRLMKDHYSKEDSSRIAANLVERYSAHEFIIDRREAGGDVGISKKSLNLGLNITPASPEIEGFFTKLTPYLEKSTVVGRIVEKSP